jgi:hypothetical protein
MYTDTNTYFCSIAGSRSYGLEVEQSDYDFLIFSSECKEKYARYELVDNYNVITSSPQRMFSQIYDTPYWATWQWFFPYEWKSKNEFTDFIRNHQNDFVYKNLPLIKQSHEYKIEITKNSFHGFCEVSKKAVAYSFLFLYLLRDLAQGKSPAECIKPTGELHDFLISVRKGEYEEQYLWERFLQLEKEKDKEIKFYSVPRDEEFFRTLKSEMEKYNFLPYEDWKKMYNN